MAVPKQLSHPADRIVSKQPLGALYSPKATTFRVWAPITKQVDLRLYASPVGGMARVVAMKHNEDGTWETTVKENCSGLYYTYTVAGKHPNREIIDPYATAVTGYNGRGIVVHDTTPVAPRPTFPPQDAIIYEMHVRDFTIDPDSGIQRRGKYLGLTETGTRLFGHADVATGLDHLVDLGVNTVQIMPISQYETDEAEDKYGWGYDSVHFNSPHGGYATERFDGRRVAETKQMIDALHKRGIRVVLDMVYNHTMETLDRRVYSFEGLVPGYYYRRKSNGSLWNGSGVGNEFRSEAPMARRFIIDSAKYWMQEYKVDGFRLDLMGLIDIDTMKEMVGELRAIDPNVLIYGEPWASGKTPIVITDKGKQRGLGFAVFNDNFRDALRGSVFKPAEQGFLQAGINIDRVKKGIAGSIDDFTAAPTETINYVECHDNHTLWDRLQLSTASDSTETDRRAMDRLAAAIIFTSQGIPFMQSGQEMLRTKEGDDNSYNKPDSVNMIRWQQKVQNGDVAAYYRGLIALRKEHPMFRMASAREVHAAIQFIDNVPLESMAYVLTDVTQKDRWSRAAVLLNASRFSQAFTLPVGGWRVFVTSTQAGTHPIEEVTSEITAARGKPGIVVTVPAHSAFVLGEPRV